jgi:hypothetical protein
MLYRDLAYLEAIDFGRSMLVFAGSSRMVPSFSAGRLVREVLNKHHVDVPTRCSTVAILSTTCVPSFPTPRASWP